jgi:gliding motility-associated-like protein
MQPAGVCGYIERSRGISPRGLIAQADFSFKAFCDSGYVRFTSKATVFPDSVNTQLFWDFGDGNTSTDTNPVHTYLSSGRFNVKLEVRTTTACLNKSGTKNIDLEVLDIHAPPDQVIDEGERVQLTVTGGGSKFRWEPSTALSNPAIANPVATPVEDITYVVTASNGAGCVDTDTIFIKVKPLTDFYVPSAFTPNNDGRNDVFKPTLAAMFTLQDFSIFNRWGQQVFATRQKGYGWNGKVNGVVQQTGVYVWIVKVVDRRGKKYERKGTVVLVK